MTIRELLKQLNGAIWLCSGIDESNNSKWHLYGIIDGDGRDVYFTIEEDVWSEGIITPYIVPCDKKAAIVLFDDAWVRGADTLNVKEALKKLRGEDDEENDCSCDF